MEKIDFVLPWVDGGDPEWRKEKGLYENKLWDTQIDSSEIRYRDWENLKYWFRAVETYAPWVHRVYFVTCGQVPEWLNLDHPKLCLVKHSDYMPKEYLPTFSSHPIELNFHRIVELSEQFVYFNDDMFLTAPVQPKDFFVKGLPCDALVENPLTFKEKNVFNQIRMNNMIFLNQHYSRTQEKKILADRWYSPKIGLHDWTRNRILGILKNPYFTGLESYHLQQPFLKSALEKAWELDAQWLHETSCHKFRSDQDLNQYVFKFVQLMEGKFTPYNRRKSGKLYQIGSQLEEICAAIRHQTYKSICMNDVNVIDEQQFEHCKNQIIAAFEEVFPEKSGFER